MLQWGETIPNSIVKGAPMFAGLTSQQSIADELKHKVDRDTDATGVQRESARHAIAAFERAEWQPRYSRDLCLSTRWR